MFHQPSTPPSSFPVSPLRSGGGWSITITSFIGFIDEDSSKLTRSHKFGERDHTGVQHAEHHEGVPRFFAKAGHAGEDPNKTKKNGGGKGNWGHPGDEASDSNYNMTNPRRRSNSSTHSHHLDHFKTKFETVEPEPVFEEEIHGPLAEDGADLQKADTESSGDSATLNGSVEEEDAVSADKKM
ncbi:hypothetical protein P152DRAFT_475134 [Eremomyces bilateralis CBS 781.70]|uniref:Hyaluronan/mRNA-binding protein domain-containing protein n=1 Tax=Eremomyces bilateralis CBS 781.70 TaxID=1392243 RepID=A0A6G1FZ12_9PEZI|nr:uncharacterized protein P152DRAFT_475134 [Eremomyces bilateralis CBS 781.70]KAF1811087.1 hypothetical protein P152DRAFT_475134 [Eremomyces bilateralis CBS 781.70]